MIHSILRCISKYHHLKSPYDHFLYFVFSQNWKRFFCIETISDDKLKFLQLYEFLLKKWCKTYVTEGFFVYKSLNKTRVENVRKPWIFRSHKRVDIPCQHIEFGKMSKGKEVKVMMKEWWKFIMYNTQLNSIDRGREVCSTAFTKLPVSIIGVSPCAMCEETISWLPHKHLHVQDGNIMLYHHPPFRNLAPILSLGKYWLKLRKICSKTASWIEKHSHKVRWERFLGDGRSQTYSPSDASFSGGRKQGFKIQQEFLT